MEDAPIIGVNVCPIMNFQISPILAGGLQDLAKEDGLRSFFEEKNHNTGEQTSFLLHNINCRDGLLDHPVQGVTQVLQRGVPCLPLCIEQSSKIHAIILEIDAIDEWRLPSVEAI